MKRAILCLMILSLASLSCGYRGYLRWFRPKLTIMEVIKVKEEIDRSENPARRYMLVNNLRRDLVTIDDALVKDVVPSNNIDYEFCVIVDMPYEKGNVECHIYTKSLYEKEDIKGVSRLKKGKSVIDVLGEFNRFFTLLDEAYTKIEIINASIALRGEK
jgi:hypothetical protein